MCLNFILKNLVLTLILACSSVHTIASEIFFLNKSNTEALALAAKMEKPFFVFYCGRWCPTCKIMEDHTFQDDEVAAFASENFLAFKANVDEPTGKEWKDNYSVFLVPTTIFFDKYGQQLEIHTSTMNATTFLEVMKRNVPTQYSSSPISNSTIVTSSHPTLSIPQSSSPKPSIQTQTPVSQPPVQNILSTVAKVEIKQLNEIREKRIDEKKSSETDEKVSSNIDTKKVKDQPAGHIENRELLGNTIVSNNPIQRPAITANNNHGIIPPSNAIATSKPMVMTGGKIWAPSKRKKKKRKANNQLSEKSENLLSNVSNADLIQKTEKAKVVQSLQDPNPVIAEPTPVKDEPQLNRPKRKSIVLNPKKEVQPRNIVIRTERTQPANVINTPVSTSANIVSMVVDKPISNNLNTNKDISFSTSYLQLGYFENHKNASVLAAKVRTQFHDNIINLKELIVDGKKVFRVTMTGFQNKDQVSEMKTKLKQSGFKSYIFDN